MAVVSGSRKPQVELLKVFFIPCLKQISRSLGLCLIMPWALLGMTGVQAANVTVVLSDDAPSYHEVADAIESTVGSEHAVIRVLSSKLSVSDSALSRAKLLVPVGVKATEQIAERGGKTPVLAVMVTEDWYRDDGRNQLTRGGRSAAALVLEQPFLRQFQLINSALPDITKVGVVVGQSNAGLLAELEKAASARQLTLVSATVDSESKLVATLGQVLADADILLAIPDAEVLNRNTVQSVLMTTYRYRDPVVGYSKSLTRAGALVSVYSSPRQIGRQAGEIVSGTLNGSKLVGLQWPKYYSISVNGHVARSLGVNVPSEQKLSQELGAEID